MNDIEFLKQFHDCSLSELSHEAHLRLAFLVLKRHDFQAAHDYISDGLRSYAASKGAAENYHETVTRFWLGLVQHCMEQDSEISDFQQLLAKNPLLLDKHVMFMHWSRDEIFSEEARRSWKAPDILPLPFT